MVLDDKTVFKLQERTPDCRFTWIPNQGLVAHPNTTPLYLPDDIGSGTLVAHLIRNEISSEFMDECAETLAYPELVRSQYHKRMLSLLSRFQYPFNAVEKSYVMQNVCQIKGNSVFLEVSDDGQGGTWILLHNGAEALTKIIADTGRYMYLDAESQMRDLALIQRFAQMNRTGTLKRLFQKYYGTPKLEDCAWTHKDFSYHSVDLRRGEVHLGIQSRRQKNKWNLFLANIRDGAILYKTTAKYAPSGCGRNFYLTQEQLDDPQYVSAVNDATDKILHSLPNLYLQRHPSLYQEVDDALIDTTDKVILSPKYNFRPAQ